MSRESDCKPQRPTVRMHVCTETQGRQLSTMQLPPMLWDARGIIIQMRVGMVELCAKNLQIMRNDFTDYARTFCQLCANYAQRF